MAIGRATKTPISRIMSVPVVTVRPELSLDSLRQLMLVRGLSRVPVVDDAGSPLGIVSTTDLVIEEHDRGDEIQEETSSPALPGFHLHADGKSVGDVMSRAVFSLPESASVAQAAEALVAHHLHGAPVRSASGALVGFLSSSDVLAWLAGLR
jgi:CBS domain-containing protein